MFSFSSITLRLLLIMAVSFIAMSCSNLSVSDYYANEESAEKTETSNIAENEVEIIATTETEIDDDIVLIEAEGDVVTQQNYQNINDLQGPCPSLFYDIQIPKNGKYCQSFAASLPATMVFFMPMSPSEAVNYYLSNNNELSITQNIKNRVMLKNDEDTKTVVVSPDGTGSQIDILIKPKLQASN